MRNEIIDRVIQTFPTCFQFGITNPENKKDLIKKKKVQSQGKWGKILKILSESCFDFKIPKKKPEKIFLHNIFVNVDQQIVS